LSHHYLLFNIECFAHISFHNQPLSLGNPKRQLKDSEEDLGKVYHDITCQCHYTFGQPLDCCHDDMQPPNKPPSQIQVSFDGLNVKGDGRTDADKTYRRNFCDGIMYLLESEGVDLSNANDAIISGLEIDIVDFDVVDVINPNDSNQAEGATAVPTITEAWTEDESSTTETLSSESPNNGNVEEDETIDENNDSSNIESEVNSDESLTKATVSIQSTPSATTTIINTIETTKEVPQFDASTSPVMLSASTTEDANTNNSNVATSATIGILFAVLAAFLAAVMAIIHRKREEKRRLAEFAGEELMDDDLEASSVHNDAVAMETMDGAKVNAESSPEVASTAEENDNDDDSDVLSVVSVDMEHNEECAQISFEKGNEGSVEAKVTVGSTLAAMGVASTVTSRLSSQQQLQQENSVDV
jgi:hypothetical protein